MVRVTSQSLEEAGWMTLEQLYGKENGKFALRLGGNCIEIGWRKLTSGSG